MGAPKLDRNLCEQIVTSRFVFGKSIEQISKEIGKGHSSIQNVVYGFESVRDEDWQRAENMIFKSGVPLSLFEWAAEKLGKRLPGSLETAYENRKGKNTQRTAKAEEETAPPCSGCGSLGRGETAAADADNRAEADQRAAGAAVRRGVPEVERRRQGQRERELRSHEPDLEADRGQTRSDQGQRPKEGDVK